ncbi:MAG: hypothetical protein IPH04_16750 [Saprospirales bacterium]|nr:hypothetical protein [Saprospirales bacterium]
MMKYLRLLILLLTLPLPVLSQAPAFFGLLEQKLPERPEKEFQFLAYYYNHGMFTNMYPENDFLKGQIIGRLYGQNTTTTSDSLRPFFFEQRLLPFLIYQPKLFDGRAILRASFEIDWTWGDVSYGVGGNFGSAVSSDQVNIQTQNVELELIPAKGWAVNLGLQRMYDTPFNPYRSFFDQLTTTGYRLMYWGTDGVGINLRHDGDFGRWKLGYYQLYENNVEENDDVTLMEATYIQHLGMALDWGGSAYYVRDRANGEGGPSVLGQGLNSILTGYNGTYRFPFGADPYKADVAWLGTFFGYNSQYMMSPWFANGFVNVNVGSARSYTGNLVKRDISILGLGANLRAGYRYGQTPNDALIVDLLYTSGDRNGASDDKYAGVLTGNMWGTPAALYISHGGYLLFPHANVVNRYISAVTDISNLGYGILGGTLNLSRDFVPNKLQGKLGTAMAWSNVKPTGGGDFMGVEANGKVAYQFGPFMSVELHGAYLWLGDFFDSPSVNGGFEQRPVDPFTAFLAFKWLMF